MSGGNGGRPGVPALLRAMRADGVPAPQAEGLWYIVRHQVPWGPLARESGYEEEGPRTLTALMRWTDATLHLGHGESVMSDDPRELRRHLPIVLQARGRVLVTGLGLGCVLRGLLARPAVRHVDVVELDPAVVAMVWPGFEGEPRAALHQGDALSYRWPPGARWDYAWHDAWRERGALDFLHTALLARYRARCGRQGAWMLDRAVKRRWPAPGLLG